MADLIERLNAISNKLYFDNYFGPPTWPLTPRGQGQHVAPCDSPSASACDERVALSLRRSL